MQLKILKVGVNGPYLDDHDYAAAVLATEINEALSLGWKRDGSVLLNTAGGIKYGQYIQIMTKEN